MTGVLQVQMDGSLYSQFGLWGPYLAIDVNASLQTMVPWIRFNQSTLSLVHITSNREMALRRSMASNRYAGPSPAEIYPRSGRARNVTARIYCCCRVCCCENARIYADI